MSTDVIFHERLEWLGANAAVARGRSDKFYEVTITVGPEWPNLFVETRRWGRFGAKGQEKRLAHATEYSARRSASEQIAKKRAKGYTRPVAPLVRLAHVMDDEED